MNLRIAIAAAIAALGLGLGPVLAQTPDDPLPDGPGKDAVVRVCTACHDADEFAFARYTPEEWDNEITKMQSAGALMSVDEQIAISKYLSTYLSKTPPPAPTPQTAAPSESATPKSDPGLSQAPSPGL